MLVQRHNAEGAGSQTCGEGRVGGARRPEADGACRLRLAAAAAGCPGRRCAGEAVVPVLLVALRRRKSIIQTSYHLCLGTGDNRPRASNPGPTSKMPGQGRASKEKLNTLTGDARTGICVEDSLAL